MTESKKDNDREVIDAIGKLCYEGRDIAAYLYQVPDDAAQQDRAKQILDTLLTDKTIAKRTEFPQVVSDMREALEEQPSAMAAEVLQAGFDRLIKLWQAARSGIF